MVVGCVSYIWTVTDRIASTWLLLFRITSSALEFQYHTIILNILNNNKKYNLYNKHINNFHRTKDTKLKMIEKTQ